MVHKRKKISDLFWEFLDFQQSQGIVLILCAIASLLISNSFLGKAWQEFWDTPLGYENIGLNKTLIHWVNDGLMSLFFLLVGLEIKRELVEGELSSLKKSLLPVIAATGGMIVPALLYTAVNAQTDSASGWGIPMATDIAFALGVLSLLGNKVPVALKIVLSALAIADDLGAIIVIALFYSDAISLTYFICMAGCVGVLFIFNRTGIDNLFLYLFLGIFLWYFTLKSGVHATIAGVLLALCIPLAVGKESGPAEKLLHVLHLPVAYIIMPVFALANTGFILDMNISEALQSRIAIGIVLGLVAGKVLGIFLFTWAGVKFKLTVLPPGIYWRHILGMGFLGGIGFTMSIFVSLLAFDQPTYQAIAKVSILCASVLSGVIGVIILKIKSS